MALEAATYTVAIRSTDCPDEIQKYRVLRADIREGGVLYFVTTDGVEQWYSPALWLYAIRDDT